MSRILTDGELKALWRQLVRASGGVEAAGVELGISHQRVSLMQSPNTPDIPNIRQIMALEVVCGQPVISGVMARAITGEVDVSVSTALVEGVRATAEAMGLVHAMDVDGERTEAEIRRVQAVTQKALREVQEAADAAACLKPGRCQ